MQTRLPADALLQRYAADEAGNALPHHTDCFSVRVASDVSLERFVSAFYTAPLFRAERVILGLVGHGSKDEDVQALLAGESRKFAAWTVEDRTDEQLLMCDVREQTRSWFKVERETNSTRLYFGSAVIARDASGPGTSYRLLMRLHLLYSRLLLRGTVRRLKRNAS